MGDSVGPDIARTIYGALFSKPVSLEQLAKILGDCYSPVISESLQDSDIKIILNAIEPIYHNAKYLLPHHLDSIICQGYSAIRSGAMREGDIEVIKKRLVSLLFHCSPRPLSDFSLAHIVDDIVRGLRKAKMPASRWATFVHIGV